MSNLIAKPGFHPSDPGQNVETVRVQDRGQNNWNPAALAADSNDEIDLRELWRALRRRKKLVGVTAAAVIVLAGLVTSYQRIFRPVFQGSFSLLITDPLSNEGGGGSAAAAASGTMFEELARNNTSNDIPTLIELLESPLLLSPIAEQFDLTIESLAKRISITTGGEKRKEAEGVLKVSVIGGDRAEDEALLKALSSTYLQAALKQRQQRLSDGLAFLNQQAPALEEKTSELQSELATFREQNNLLEPTQEGVALKQRSAELDAQILGQEAERSRLLKVRGEIVSGNLSARGFQEAISTGSGAGSNGSVNQAQGLAISDADQSLLQQLLKVETELAEARSKYNPSSSIVTSLEARLNQLQPLLRQNQVEAVDAALTLNAGRLATAREQAEKLKKMFLQQPALIKQFETIQQRLKIVQDNLAGLVSARETLQLEIAQSTVPWLVIAPAKINPNPIKPSVPRNLALGTMLGLVAGVGAGLLRDRFDHVFHQPVDVKDDLNLPLLGHVPHVTFFKGVREDKRFLLQELDQSVQATNSNPIDADNNNNSPFESNDNRREKRYERFFYQEAFRNLYTSIRFLNAESPLRAIALTSSLPAEGKSLVNVLLAKTLSELGQRVLLVDADLRKPQMHRRLGLNNLSGLSNLLAEGDQGWRDVVQTVPGYSNWSVITAGRRPPDPTRLLSSQRMSDLVQELANGQNFDLVLFDTPPVLGLADASLVAEHCDGLMLLVSLNRVDRNLPKESMNRLLSSGVPLLGVVTNAIKEDKSASGAGYGKYGYGKYGYGKYGYGSSGYAGYNTYSAAVYAHYANATDDSDQEQSPSEQQLQRVRQRLATPPSWRHRWIARSKRWIRWIDS
ncbi:polysaccharide biosynthesis tyrosine autokinase [Synechococcus sp. AH-224-G16]|nr:polysaccharide biosynthesis tyrosine autokinase [Synechococcus sp. AH-224-G16]